MKNQRATVERNCKLAGQIEKYAARESSRKRTVRL